jgi:hypothetical protein
MAIVLKYTGNDNYGKPKQEFITKLKSLDDNKLGDECNRYIWLSAYANNNPRSDYHWQCDACFDECAKRGKVEIYEKAYNSVSKSI